MTTDMHNTNSYPDLPRVAVSVAVQKEGCLLAVKRKKEPCSGLWAFPGGSVELGETLAEAAAREVLEETGVSVLPAECFRCVDAIYRDKAGSIEFHYVIIYMRAVYVSGSPTPMDDAEDAAWIHPERLLRMGTDPATQDIVLSFAGADSRNTPSGPGI